MLQFQTIAGRPARWFAAALIASVVGIGWGLDWLGSDESSPVRASRSLDGERASPEVRQLAQWVLESGDHGGGPFLIVDKAQARLFAFAGDGRVQGSTPVLLGAARGDAPAAAATPAGRFVAEVGLRDSQARLAWFNGQTELRLYGARGELTPGRAASRLASDRVEDKRISDGSLHVPPEFFRRHLSMLRNRLSVVYVLPETVPQLRLAHWPGTSTRRPS